MLQTLTLAFQYRFSHAPAAEVHGSSCSIASCWVCTQLHRASLQNKLLLQRVLLLFVPGIDRDLFEASARLLPNMHRLLGEPTAVMAKSPTVSPGTLAR
jgi:hypothetical protein